MKRQIAILSLSLALAPFAHAGWDGLDRGGEIEESMKLTPNTENGKRLYNTTCVHCHTENGQGMEPGIGQYRLPGTYPQLAGQHQSVLIKQILDIRQLNRDNPSMYPFSTERYLGGPQNIADVTAYISELPSNTNNQHGNGQNLEVGKQLYIDNCAKCHGKKGEGDAENFYPRLANQHYEYMLRQFIWIKDGKRRNANRKMVKQIQNFKYSEMKAVVDYASRLVD